MTAPLGVAASRRLDTCQNCGAGTPDLYCAVCGQKAVDYHASLREVAGDIVDELFQLDSRIGRTIVPFLFRPGKLTNEFNAGRRRSYSSPLRLYLLVSFLYFLLRSLVPNPQFGQPGAVLSEQDRQQIATELAPLRQQGGFYARAEERLEQFMAQDRRQMARQVSDSLASKLPKAMFVLLPVFALLLKLLYRRRLVVEHLVFALHSHSFFFAISLPSVFWPSYMGYLRDLVTIVYVGVALRVVYRASWGRTIVKYLLLLMGYGVVILFALAAIVSLTVLWG
jgi:hypothetical protein